MARTGSALIAVLLLASPAFAGASEVEFYMSADRTKVGTEDTFRVDIVVSGAPQGAVVQFPTPPDFEVLSRGESTQMSFSAGPGGAGVVTSVRKHTLVMRANRVGHLTIPPAVLQTANREYKTSPLTIDVVAGRLAPDRPQRRPDPFGLPPGFLPPGFGDNPFDEPDVPASDSDVFIRATVDKPEVVVGEQMTYTLHIYARLDLSSVDSVKPPRLDGFFSADLKVPTTLVPESRTVNGVRYREYLLRSRALFALKPGKMTIEPAEAEITSGSVFTGRRISRKSNTLAITVKPLPPGGNDSSLVGQWRMTREVSQTNVKLGDPVQVKLRVEGRGNVQLIKAPPLNAPAALKTYDPETKDSSEARGSSLIGARTIEYTLVPQQTGDFVLPASSLTFYDPSVQAWQTATVEPVTISVTPSTSGATALGTAGPLPTSPDGPKNQLVGGGLKSLRHSAHFSGPTRATWARGWFLPLAAAPLLLTLLLGALGVARKAFVRETPESKKKQQARAARKRLAAAEKLARAGSTTEFYAEVERALISFLETRLDSDVKGLTRPELATRLTAAQIPDDERDRILRVLETCDMGRYAPGMGEASARARAVDDAAAAMEHWS